MSETPEQGQPTAGSPGRALHSTIIGVGIDVVSVARFARSMERTPKLRGELFTRAEAGLSVESLAARFAAKEALAKALGAPPNLEWHDAEIQSLPSGQPEFTLRGTVADHAAALGVRQVRLSMSHDGDVATAIVILAG